MANLGTKTGTSILNILLSENITTTSSADFYTFRALKSSGSPTYDESYNVQVVNFYDKDKLFAASDISSYNDTNSMLILVYHGGLTVNSGVELKPPSVKKGFFVLVKGKLINNGKIHMNSLGWSGAGQDVWFADLQGIPEKVPANSTAIGGVEKTRTSGNQSAVYDAGEAGQNGTDRMTGAGGSGGLGFANNSGTSVTATSGAGASGTSYAGGSGGGGIVIAGAISPTPLTAPSGGVDAGSGGAGRARISNAFLNQTLRNGTGGAGAGGGGVGQITQAANTTAVNSAGSNGTTGAGGLVIVAVMTTYTGSGNIESKGSPSGTPISSTISATGGSSGGGSINIIYGTSSPTITTDASGGISPASAQGATGGNGGAGSVTTPAAVYSSPQRKSLFHKNGKYYRYTPNPTTASAWIEIATSLNENAFIDYGMFDSEIQLYINETTLGYLYGLDFSNVQLECYVPN